MFEMDCTSQWVQVGSFLLEFLFLPYLKWRLYVQDIRWRTVFDVFCCFDGFSPQLGRKVRRPQEEAARSTNDGAKSALGNGISLKDVRGVSLYHDSKGLAQRLEPPSELSFAVTVYFHDADTFRISDILDNRLKSLRGFVSALDWNSPPHP